MMFKLSMMMFLQFFIWGAWFELGFSFIPALKFRETWMNPLVFGAFNIGALVALFFSTQFADRKFAAEKFLSVSHLIGGLAIAALAFLQVPYGVETGNHNSGVLVGKGDSETSGRVVQADKSEVLVENVTVADDKDGKGATQFWEAFSKLAEDKRPVITYVFTGPGKADAQLPLAPFWPFFFLMLLHSVFYVPTISITNSIAFNAFTNPEKQFGPVRLWGTIGWIAASWPFIFILCDWHEVSKLKDPGFTQWLGAVFGSELQGAGAQEAKKYIFILAGIASLVLAGFSLLLPHTPPKPATGEDSYAWLKAMKLLKKPFLLVLFLVTFVDAAVHQSYFIWTFDYLTKVVNIPTNWALPVMKIGQIAEVVTMLFLGYVLKNLGWRFTMIIGVLGHAARFAVFAFVPNQTASILVILLHGVCYAFFFATVYIFVDKYFPKDIRSSAQGLFNVLILGIGPFVAGFVCQELRVKYTDSANGSLNYSAIFEFSMFSAIVAAILLLLFFHPPAKEETTDA